MNIYGAGGGQRECECTKNNSRRESLNISINTKEAKSVVKYSRSRY